MENKENYNYIIMKGLNDNKKILIDREHNVILDITKEKDKYKVENITKEILKFYKNSDKMGNIYFNIFIKGNTNRYDLIVKTDYPEIIRKELNVNIFLYTYLFQNTKDYKEKDIVLLNDTEKGIKIEEVGV